MIFLTTLLDWLLNRNKYFTGVNPDTRFESEKQKDYDHAERAISLPVDPFSNQKIVSSGYFYENQNNTSSCVPHAVGLALAIERKADLGDYERIAQMFPYRLRSNYPNEGSVFQNIFEIYRTKGAPLYTTMPTPMTEAQANNMVVPFQAYTEANIFKGFSYWTLKSDFNDIATLAGIAELGHGIPILIYATYDEYAQMYPQIQQPNLTIAKAEVSHCVCILPHSGFRENGKRYVAIQDSAHFGDLTIRYLSEDFIKARTFAAGYWQKVVALSSGPRPKHYFAKIIHYGDTGVEVLAMQQLFVAEGLLPSDCQTGLFAGRTLAALHAFQARYANDILIPNQLSRPTDLFGRSSIDVANKLCGSV